MVAPVDLTLLVLRLVQGEPRPPLREWIVVPHFERASQDAVRARLEAAQKPLVVAPLLEAGYVGVWSVPSLEQAARAMAERRMAKRREYLEAQLHGMWPHGVDAVRLQEQSDDLRVDVASFHAWVCDYYIPIGIGLDREADPRIARLILRPPGGNRRPIGLPEDFATRLPSASPNIP